ncbi:hypothetical protein Q5P01_001150 [Channa striata]|uniref:Uncharacterized protein n=1 Tax=Channa striata TaxID=64152 RepID=A0AA88T3N4_CHASR|nr:hypothetical protein Q5P01_001150 [Channa striata]
MAISCPPRQIRLTPKRRVQQEPPDTPIGYRCKNLLAFFLHPPSTFHTSISSFLCSREKNEGGDERSIHLPASIDRSHRGLTHNPKARAHIERPGFVLSYRTCSMQPSLHTD